MISSSTLSLGQSRQNGSASRFPRAMRASATEKRWFLTTIEHDIPVHIIVARLRDG